MSEPFLGEIRIVGFNFAPRGWAQCDGQLLPISQNSALFALLGTQFGGDGRTTFALPDLRGRAPIHQGRGAGLSDRFIGEGSGAESVTLQISEMPTHQHAVSVALPCSTDDATLGSPKGNVPAVGNASGAPANGYAANPTPDASMAASTATCTVAGNSLPHNNMPPFLTMNFVIALTGIFPTRN